MQKIYRGQSYEEEVQYLKDGVAQPLAGCTVLFTVKPVAYDDSTTDTTAIIKKDITDHVDEANGITKISLTSADTLSPLVVPGVYYRDIWVVEPDNERYPLEIGKIKIVGTPTNRII